jgi:hypothetical protein
MASGDTVAMAAIGGSVLVALSSLTSTWMTQRHEDRRDLLQREIVRREALYSKFITETARDFIAAAEQNLTDTNQLVAPYALLSRIRLTASPQVLTAAEAVIKEILEAYEQPNLTPEQIQARARDGGDPLKEFSTVCRAELEGLRKRSLW